MDDFEEEEELELAVAERGLTWSRLSRESAKAILLNAVTPLACLVETAVLGSIEDGYRLLSLYTIVTASTQFSSVVFNFLSDGVCAKVSSSVGKGDASLVRKHVRYSFLFATLGGVTCSILLMACFEVVMLAAGLTSDSDRRLAKPFYFVKALTVPLIQLSLATTGVLSGYGRLGLACCINLVRAALSIAGTCVALILMKGGLLELGLSGVLAYVAATVLGAACVLSQRPPGPAFAAFTLLGKSAEGGSGSALQSPLLANGSGQSDAVGPSESHFWDFVSDGAAMLVRSLALQATFFASALIAGRLPGSGEALAAHGVVLQLWMLTSYIADGFANVGTLVGGKYFGSWGAIDRARFAQMAERLCFMGILTGFVFCVAMLLFEDDIISIFTIASAGPSKDSPSQAKVRARLHEVWNLLCLMQPINSTVFVYDGIIYAAQRFVYVRNLMVSGLLLAFAPVLLFANFHGGLKTNRGLVWIWGAKSAMNAWRLVGLVTEIHCRVLAEQ